MARSAKSKQMESAPRPVLYMPSGWSRDDVPVAEVAVEDFEAFRLVDGHGCTLEEAAHRMNCSRSTAGRMLERARRILARGIERHAPICVDAAAASNFVIAPCPTGPGSTDPLVGAFAVAVDREEQNAKVSGVFGRAAAFAIYLEELDRSAFCPNPGITRKRSAAWAATRLLKESGVKRVVAGRFGVDALKYLSEAGIEAIAMQDLRLQEIENFYQKS